MPTTGERRKRGGGEGRSERGGERTLGEGEGEGEEGEEGKGRGERERERFIRNYLHERERERAPRREGGGEGERERERERGSRRGSKERLLNAVHVPTDTPTGRPVQHKYGQRHDHDKHAHVGWCVHAQTAKSCHTRCHPGGQDGDGRRGKDWWDLSDLSGHTHTRTVLRVEPRLHKISVSSAKGPMSVRHTRSYRIHIASLPPRNGSSLPVLAPHDFRRRGRERCARSLDSGRLTAAPTPACTAESGPVNVYCTHALSLSSQSRSA